MVVKMNKRHTLVFVHGFLGSELVRQERRSKRQTVLWSKDIDVIRKCVLDDTHREMLRFRLHDLRADIVPTRLLLHVLNEPGKKYDSRPRFK